MMRLFLILTFLVVIIFSRVFIAADRKFPENFLFGTASSAYQIEGGHNANGKGENIWDYHLRINPELIQDGSNGNIACDSYHKYKEDVELLSYLNVDYYRFSISWSRVLPNGYDNEINPDGIRYYNNLIDELKRAKIEPMVTLYHFDLPQKLQDIGGWTNPLIADYFEDYARVVFRNFGDRVKLWITMNKNWAGYGDDLVPPRLNQSGVGEYLFVKGMLLAHAKAYHLYHEEFSGQNGKIGIVLDGRWFEPASSEDEEAAERVRQFLIGISGNPIYGTGDFPQIVKDRVDDLSKRQGFSRSRLPKLSQDEVNYIKGTADFYGLNTYTAFLIEDNSKENLQVSLENDLGVKFSQDRGWPGGKSQWLKVVPWGIRKTLNWIKKQYGDIPIFITENGFSDNGEIEDYGRISYMESHLDEVLNALLIDGVNVQSYTAWSLLDNFEWISGYSEKFGLFQVNFDDPNRKRTKKASADWYKALIGSRRLPADTTKQEL